jgi:hypothetical protein
LIHALGFPASTSSSSDHFGGSWAASPAPFAALQGSASNGGPRALTGRLGSALAGRLLPIDLEGDPARDLNLGDVETDE